MTQGARGAAASLAIAALLAAISAAPAAPLTLRPCGGGAEGDRTRCGAVVVPLDRAGVIPGSVRLRVRVLPPRRGSATGTIVALAGGPGQAATPLIASIADTLEGPLRSRRLVTFDQRGTGRSGRLRCPSLGRIRRRADVDPAVAACAERIGVARTAYTSAASVEDLDAVRAALGDERVAIYAVSYGTKVALDYAALHPDRVSALVLDSVVPQEGSDPFLRPTLTAAPRVLGAVCGPRGCPFTRDPGADLAALVRRIARAGPVRGRWYDARGRAHPVAIGRPALLALLLQGDTDPYLRAALPAAIRAAGRGDAAPLARLLASGTTGLDASQDSDALYLATTCEDGPLPWPAGTPPERRAEVTRAALAAVPAAELLPFDRATLARSGLLDVCRAWPESPIAQPRGPLPAVPTLILSGEEDLRTPHADAQALARQMPSARLLPVPATGHSVLSQDLVGCATAQTARFLAGLSVRDCGRADRLFAARPLPPRRLAALAPTRGAPPRVGRTYRAAALTLGDAGEHAFLMAIGLGPWADGFGGLRGGSVRMTERAVVIRRYSYVGGVWISARADAGDRGPLVLRVGGPAAAGGTIRIGERGAVGTLGGRRVRLTARLEPSGRAAGMGGDVGATLLGAAARVRRALARAPDAQRWRPPATGPGPVVFGGIGAARR